MQLLFLYLPLFIQCGIASREQILFLESRFYFETATLYREANKKLFPYVKKHEKHGSISIQKYFPYDCSLKAADLPQFVALAMCLFDVEEQCYITLSCNNAYNLLCLDHRKICSYQK